MLLQEDDRMYLPFGLNLMNAMGEGRGSVRVFKSCPPFEGSHILMVPSMEPVASSVPSRLKCTVVTG